LSEKKPALPSPRPPRRSLPPGRAARAAALLVAVEIVASAATPPKGSRASLEACIHSFEGSQEDRSAGRLIEAREKLQTCANSCAAPLQGQCATWLGEVTAAQPSIVVTRRSADGREVPEGEVWIDGRKAAPRPGGPPIELNPGDHEIQIRLTSGEENHQRISLRQGEKSHPVVFESSPVVPRSQPVPAPSETPARVSPWAYPALGLGVVGLGVFAGLGLSARARAQSLRESCSPACPTEEVDAVRHRALGADIALGVGLGGAVVGLWLLLHPGPAAASPAFGPVPGGGWAGITGRF
jgi:hypothetical protein